MEPEWNNSPNLDDVTILGFRQMDTDDYINSLTRKIQDLETSIDSLKLEVRTQRKEIAGLREERRMLLNNDSVPGRCIDFWPSISTPPEKNND